MSVHLGFPKKSPKLEISQAPLGKIGGSPLWLNDSPLPTCCNSPSIFICQILAPGLSDFAYYRYLYIFQCPTCRSPLAFRSQLPRLNPIIIEAEELKDPEQIIDDWNADSSPSEILSLLSTKPQSEDFSDLTMEIFEEDSKMTEVINRLNRVDSKVETQVCELIELMEGGVESAGEEKISNSAEEDDEEEFDELEERNLKGRDLSFDVLRWVSAFNVKTPVVRYGRNAEVLWYSDKERPEIRPGMCGCGSVRTFECQILPQIITMVTEGELDFGMIFVFTCPAECDISGLVAEEAFYQPSM